MAMFSAHFDDSGTDSKCRIAVASCYVGKVEQWDLLTKAWDEIRKQQNLQFEYFGTSDCFLGRNDFDGWSPRKKDDLIRYLICLIHIRTRIGFSAAVIKDAYDSVLTGWKRRIAGETHFAFAVKDCLRQIKRWRDEYKVSEPIEYVFDLMGEGKEEIEAILADLQKCDPESFGIYENGYSFKNKRLFPPLHGACQRV